MSLNAYQTLQKKVETPRETEYRLFMQVTRALIEAASLPKTEIARRMDALDWNRRVWSFLASDCYDPNNGLPEQLRAGIISLRRLTLNAPASSICLPETTVIGIGTSCNTSLLRLDVIITVSVSGISHQVE